MADTMLEPTEVDADSTDTARPGRNWWYIVGTIVVVSMPIASRSSKRSRVCIASVRP
jgi:hypothetical protein